MQQDEGGSAHSLALLLSNVRLVTMSAKGPGPDDPSAPLHLSHDCSPSAPLLVPRDCVTGRDLFDFQRIQTNLMTAAQKHTQTSTMLFVLKLLVVSMDEISENGNRHARLCSSNPDS